MRVVIELKRGELAEIVLNNLYKLTQLQDSFGMNMVALVDGQPRLLNLKQFLEYFLQHRREVVVRRTRFELRKARERGHILEGLAVALSNVDEIIALIKAAATPPEAKAALMAQVWRSPLVEEMLRRAAADAARPDGPAAGVRLARRRDAARLPAVRRAGAGDPRAAAAAPDRPRAGQDLRRVPGRDGADRRLARHPREARARHGDRRATSSPAIRDQFGDARRSEIVAQGVDLSMEDLIAPQDMVVTLSHGGYMKAQPVAEYRAQKRGGRGRQATATKEDDFIDQLFIANTHDFILCFSNRGRVYWLKVYNVPQGTRVARGKPIVNLVPLAGEREDHRDPAGQGVHRHPVRVHGDRDGHGQEDAAVRVLAPAHVRHHRRRPDRRRLADRRRADRRHARRDAVQLRRQGGALRRERRAADGAQRARRARHDARPRRSA